MELIHDDQLIYIIGVGRSGTSMLMTLLNGHSHIAFTPETHFLRFYMGSEDSKRQIENRGADWFLKLLENDPYFQRLQLPAEDLLAPYLSGDKVFDLTEIYREILSRYLHRRGKSMIGDKDPRYIDYLPVIKSLFPRARIIHIYRDPRDMVLSKTKAEWSAHRPYWVNALISQIQMKRGRATARELFADRYYELAYETLISEPEATLSRLLTFLGLEFEPAMLDLKQSAQELVDPAEMQWKDRTFQPVISRNKEKWRQQLTPRQIRCIEIICREWFDHLGYELSDISIPFLQEKLLRTAFSADRLTHWLYRYQLERQMNKQVTELKDDL